MLFWKGVVKEKVLISGLPLPPSSDWFRPHISLKKLISSLQFSRSVAQSCLILCDPMDWSTPGLPASSAPGVYSNSCPLSRWCQPTSSSSVVPFSSHLLSFPASGSFAMSLFFTSGGQSIGVSISVLQWIFRTDFLQANKNIMIISLDKKKHLTKSHNKIPFIIKTLRKLKIEGNFLNLIRLIL